MITDMEQAKQLILKAIEDQYAADRPWARWVDIGAVRDMTVLQHQLFDTAMGELVVEGLVSLAPNPSWRGVTANDEYNAVEWAGQRTNRARLPRPTDRNG